MSFQFTDYRSKLNPLLFVLKRKSLLIEVLLWTFWFIALLPGRVGYDTKLALEMLRRSESTSWWTAWYWNILRILTFQGTSVVLFSVISLVLAYFSFRWFINSLTESNSTKVVTKLLMLVNPCFPVFVMTVQHDCFLLYGILILVGLELRIAEHRKISSRDIHMAFLLASILIITTNQGIAIMPFVMFRWLYLNKFRFHVFIFVFLVCILGVFLPTKSVSSVDRNEGLAIPALMDVKCIVQHPDVLLDSSQWEVLTRLLPKETWLKPFRCDEINANTWIDEVNYEKLNYNSLFPIYLKLITEYGEIAIMSHIARSTFVLPPPFFPVPQNQVNLDLSVPLGANTNVALQNGPTLLHPSVDDPNVRINNPFVVMTYLAQIPIFLINQASWFWGWGGLWLWPCFIYLLRLYPFRRVFLILGPILFVHTFLFALGISATGRHVMSANVIGQTFLLILLTRTHNSKLGKKSMG